METRAMAARDRDMVRAWRNQREVASRMYTDHYITADEHARWFEQVLRDPTRRYWIASHQGRDVGLGCLYNIDFSNQRASSAIYLGDMRLAGGGMGALMEYVLVDRCFQEPYLNKMCCEVLDDNQGVVKGHLTFGFVQEGYLRQHVVKGGKPQNVILMSVLRQDWLVRRQELAERMARIEQRIARQAA
jgi:UDP-4-amino-4,6-dideoxy-N-acetyl-beta-L-altrosamine N-acetyltransferase